MRTDGDVRDVYHDNIAPVDEHDHAACSVLRGRTGVHGASTRCVMCGRIPQGAERAGRGRDAEFGGSSRILVKTSSV